MKLPVVVLLLCVSATVVRGAVVQFLWASRFVAVGGESAGPGPGFEDYEGEWPGVPGPGTGSAGQVSRFLPDGVRFSAVVTGGESLSLSVLSTGFRVTERVAWSAGGRFSLLGESGFACVSLVSLPLRTSLLLDEVAGDPPAVSLERMWEAAGVLEPGDYELEAIVHTGGQGAAHRGGMEMFFSVPEPGLGLAAAVGAWLARRRRRERGL